MKNKIDFFHPLILPLALLIFLVMGYIGSFNYRFTDPLNANVILTVIFACIIFTAGVLLVNRDFEKKELQILSEKLLIALVVSSLILQCINIVLFC